jgi:hypothetical protein
MKKLFLIITILVYSIANSQTTEESFKTKYPKVKAVEVKSDKLEMGYQDQYNNDSDLIAYRVNGIFINYDNGRWFIPFNNIQSIDPKEEVALLIYLKEDNYYLKGVNN